ncbi:MAG: PAS domain-containing sensor histidine kinase [Bacteroidota bacterium]
MENYKTRNELLKENKDLKEKLRKLEQNNSIHSIPGKSVLFESLINYIPAIIYLKNIKGRILWVNREFEKFCKKKSNNIIDQFDSEIIPDFPQKKSLLEKDKETLEKNQISHLEESISLDNKIKYYLTIRLPFIPAEGENPILSIIRWDITARKNLYHDLIKNEKKFRIIFNLSSLGIAFLDASGYFVSANPALEKITGYSQLELMAMNFRELSYDEDKLNEENIMRKAIHEKKEGYEIEKRLLNKDHSIYWVKTHIHLHFSQKYKDEVEYIVMVFEDVTGEKKSGEELQQKAKDLKELNWVKDRIFSIISHDLKNPFNNIIGFSQLLQENIDKYSKQKIKQFAKSIQISANQGYDLLVNLLDWSRSQAGYMKYLPQEVNIFEIIDENIQLLKVAADNKQIKIENGALKKSYAHVDPHMISAVIRNLLSNAIKFTYPMGEIKIKSRKVGDYLEILIKDNGIGMSKEILCKIFQINQDIITLGTNNEKGTGLGLSLCKEFVEKNKGQIEVKSQENKGSAFIIKLPIKQN